VLYVGVGRGEEALEAARRGADVTGLDCSPAMLDRFRGSLDADGLSARVVVGDLFAHSAPRGGYDCIAAHFVLNVFPRDVVREALGHLAAQLRPGGRIVVADFAPPSGALGLLARAYYRLVNLAGWSLGLAALHPIYDYGVMLEALGWKVIRRVKFGPYESLTATRVGSDAAC
jgi:demethylmenaquinone methyltransferase/2-methoxy-6-polyprenyl-1,4-benzoquinol methylase